MFKRLIYQSGKPSQCLLRHTYWCTEPLRCLLRHTYRCTEPLRCLLRHTYWCTEPLRCLLRHTYRCTEPLRCLVLKIKNCLYSCMCYVHVTTLYQLEFVIMHVFTTVGFFFLALNIFAVVLIIKYYIAQYSVCRIFLSVVIIFVC